MAVLNIVNETQFSDLLRNDTNRNDRCYAWRVEPSIYVGNVGIPDVWVALGGVVYPIELKVAEAKDICALPRRVKVRRSQAVFLSRLIRAGLSTYIGLGYIGTTVWWLLPIVEVVGLKVLWNRDGVVRCYDTFDLVLTITKSNLHSTW